MKAVITTINNPTEAIRVVAGKCDLIVVADNKTPNDWRYDGVEYIPVEEQNDYNVSRFIPQNHYARKNIGYLNAIKSGVECIYDTDDDNVPNSNWGYRSINCDANVIKREGWFNVYKQVCNTWVWPRGLPMRNVSCEPYYDVSAPKSVFSSIQQGLADGEADVDAIWRLMFGAEIIFRQEKSMYLPRNTWCPFNSQSTWWFSKAYPLMYLPVTATMRMTDIWRSFVAQRCLWEIGEGVTFHSPSEVFQKRNEHDLLKDFEDEVPGYLKNEKIVEVLGNLKLKQGVENICDNLYTCYKELENEKIYPMHETRSVHAWIEDIKKIWKP